ncbi:MAG: alpha/beta hydrolase [Bdellovibrionota bacterium]
MSSANARTCRSIFAVEHKTFQKNSVQSNLHTKLETVSNSKGNVLLIHGLGDDLTHLNKLSADFRKAGYSVLRVDLHGHGKTLEDFTKNEKHLPTLLPYENNVIDLTQILKDLDFQNPIIVGHSYGGAIAHALANNLQGHKSFRPTHLVMLAPYLRRLDYSYLTGNPLIDAQTEYMGEQYMRNSYREYFESQKRKNVDLLVNAAIATTKGIRSFNLLSAGKKASLDFQIPLLVIAGTKDELVKQDQIDNFHNKLQNEGYDHKIITLEGDHFFPRTLSKETFKVIIGELDRR